MGWLVQDTPLRNDTPEAYIRRQFTYTNEHETMTVLATAMVNDVIYAAVRCKASRFGAPFVLCMVVLIMSSEERFGYKDMDERMGPYECDCPDHIMKMLSPVDHLPNASCAASWRARVAAKKAANARAA